MELEWLATEVSPAETSVYDVEISENAGADSPLLIDTRPLFGCAAEELRGGAPAAVIARRFHSTLVAIVVEVCRRLRQRTRLEGVALSGGVFQNALLTTDVVAQLEREGFRVYRHRRVPPGDGGLSLGQLAVAAAGITFAACHHTQLDESAVF